MNKTDIKYNGGGVYAIINNADRKIYIGQSSNIAKRLEKHKSAMKNGKHIYNELNDGFQAGKIHFRILRKENIHDRRLLLEKIYIYTALNKGLNLYNHSNEMKSRKQLQEYIVYWLLQIEKTETDLKEILYDVSGYNTINGYKYGKYIKD